MLAGGRVVSWGGWGMQTTVYHCTQVLVLVRAPVQLPLLSAWVGLLCGCLACSIFCFQTFFLWMTSIFLHIVLPQILVCMLQVKCCVTSRLRTQLTLFTFHSSSGVQLQPKPSNIIFDFLSVDSLNFRSLLYYFFHLFYFIVNNRTDLHAPILNCTVWCYLMAQEKTRFLICDWRCITVPGSSSM